MSVKLTWLETETIYDGWEIYKSDAEGGIYTLLIDLETDPEDEPIYIYIDADGTASNWYKIRSYDLDSEGIKAYSEYSDKTQAKECVTCRVYGNIKDLTSEAFGNANIQILTQPRNLLGTDTNVIVPDMLTLSTDANGWWQTDLYPNSLLEPVDSYYIFRFIGEGHKYERAVYVPEETEKPFIDLERV